MKRKVIQIQMVMREARNMGPTPYIIALCDDGTMWYRWGNSAWMPLDDVPQKT